MKRIVCAVLLVLTLVWIGFIFSNSLDNGTESSEKSGAVYRLVNHVAHALGVTREIPESFIRTAAHFTEFAILGFLFATDVAFLVPLHCAEPISKRHAWVFLALPLSIVTAVTDEIIQRFSPGRAMQFVDVVVDSSGALCGMLAFAALFLLFRAVACRRASKRDDLT